MKLVVVESPYAGDVEANLIYARRCIADCLRRGEAPTASHLLYTQPGVLDDAIPTERAKGMNAGFAWGVNAEGVVVYVDRGISPGMRKGIEHYRGFEIEIEVRALDRPVTYDDVIATLPEDVARSSLPPASRDIINDALANEGGVLRIDNPPTLAVGKIDRLKIEGRFVTDEPEVDDPELSKRWAKLLRAESVLQAQRDAIADLIEPDSDRVIDNLDVLKDEIREVLADQTSRPSPDYRALLVNAHAKPGK